MDRISREQYRASIQGRWTINCSPKRQPKQDFSKVLKIKDLAAAKTGVKQSPSRAYKAKNGSGTLRRINTTTLCMCQNGNKEKKSE
jgi:hypothetical protein